MTVVELRTVEVPRKMDGSVFMADPERYDIVPVILCLLVIIKFYELPWSFWKLSTPKMDVTDTRSMIEVDRNVLPA
jgi:hypothetical protein